MSTLYILRGLPGAGKSTLAKKIVNPGMIFEADMYFIEDDGSYNFDASKLGRAHEWCQGCVNYSMSKGYGDIVVSNTTTTEKEIQPYLDMAAEHNYQVVSLVVENRHGGKSVHDVPEQSLEKMRNRFSVKL